MTYSTIALNSVIKLTIADIRYVYQSVWSIKHNEIIVELGNFQNKILKQKDENGKPLISELPKDKQKLRKQVSKGAPKLFQKTSKSERLSHPMMP